MKRALAVIALALTASAASAAEPADQLRVYEVKGVGALALRVPWEWKQKRNEDSAFPSFEWRPIKGPDFTVRIEALPAAKRCRVPCDLESVRFIVGNTASEVKARSLEPQIKLEPLKGRNAQGYYFNATDRAPKPGEFKFLTQGVLATGELVVYFRILVNDGQQEAVRTALAVLSGARQVKLPPPKPGPQKAMPEKPPQKKS